MAQSIHEEGTYTDTPSDTWDSVQTTSPNITDGVMTPFFSLDLLAANETFEARFRMKDAASGTLRVVAGSHLSWTGVQSEPLKTLGAFNCIHDWDLQFRQRTGTGRAVKWFIGKVV